MAKSVKIFLDRQNRHRDYVDYKEHLAFDPNNLYSAGKSILTIGGGVGVYHFPYRITAKITNIDLKTHHKLSKDAPYKISSIQGDFIKSDFNPDMFDEIWALYSLPLYCTSVTAVKLFLLKSLYSLKPGGTLRISPTMPMLDKSYDGLIEKENSNTNTFNSFYTHANKLAKLEIANAKFFWPHIYHEHVLGKPKKPLIEDLVLSNFNFKKYHYIKHDFNINNIYVHADISKPNDSANKYLKEQIINIENFNDFSKLIVHFEKEQLEY